MFSCHSEGCGFGCDGACSSCEVGGDSVAAALAVVDVGSARFSDGSGFRGSDGPDFRPSARRSGGSTSDGCKPLSPGGTWPPAAAATAAAIAFVALLAERGCFEEARAPRLELLVEPEPRPEEATEFVVGVPSGRSEAGTKDASS
jgi:hypothetical protein